MKITDILKSDLYAGKTVFVTGGGSGINLGVAKTYASLGANVGICGRTMEKLEKAATEIEEYGVKVFFDTADVRDADRLAEVMAKCEEEIGSISTLVCAAAGNFLCPAEQMSPNAFKTVVDIDLLGSFNACKAAHAQLKKTKGDIVFISAGMSYMPYAAQAHVGAAKSGIDNLMRNLALEWGPQGIRSNSIVPGPIEGTEGMKRLAPGELGKKLTSMIPLQRMGQAEDIGNAAAYLSSPLASYVTGTVLIVDGGQNLPGSGPFTMVAMEAMKQARG